MKKISYDELIQASKARKTEAQILLDKKRWHASIYLGGYAVEIAIKAIIAKGFSQEIFFSKKSTDNIYTHDLEKLIFAAGLKNELIHKRKNDTVFDKNWHIVESTWNESLRYETGLSSAQAKSFYKALTQRRVGVLSWIRSKW